MVPISNQKQVVRVERCVLNKNNSVYSHATAVTLEDLLFFRFQFILWKTGKSKNAMFDSLTTAHLFNKRLDTGPIMSQM